MFNADALREGLTRKNTLVSLPPPIRGLNVSDVLSAMKPTDAIVLENWIPHPDRLEMRRGAAAHVTGTDPVLGLHAWNGPSTRKLFATCDSGIYDASGAGAVGASVSTITEGVTYSTMIATNAGHYLYIANATDDARHYNGSSWTTVATFGSLNSDTICGLETYKQRLYFIQQDTLVLWYLPVNSITGSATSYDLGAILRRGGRLQGIATWTVDAGNGPDDHLVVITSEGEIAVFSGTDPSSLNTWSLLGVYYLAKPIGPHCLYKYAGDILVLTEAGVLPMTKALQTAQINRSTAITDRVEQLFTTLAETYRDNDGWQMVSMPNVPVLLVNVPGYPGGLILGMQSKTQGWFSITGWEVTSLARMGNELFLGRASDVSLGLTGADDWDTNIVGRAMWAFNSLGSPRDKHVTMVRPTFSANGTFNYSLGIASNFDYAAELNTVSVGTGSQAVWDSALWDTGVWSAGEIYRREWRAIADFPGTHKALLLEIATKTTRPSIQACDLLITPEGTF